MPNILETQNITYTYSAGTPFEHAALRGVDFAIEPGECVGIIGHTGSGKSTFVQHLNGLLKPASGRVLLAGRDIHESKETTRAARFRVGLVFQFPEYQLFEETVYKDIAFGPKNMGLPEAEINERVREAAGFVGLFDEYLHRSPFQLSGGQKRRAAIAGVIAMRPEVLILDEPTAGLDPQGRDELLANIDAYRQKRGAAILIVTHSMEEAARRADRVYVFEDARVTLSGAPVDVFAHGAELDAMGLSIPVPARIAQRLRDMGVPLAGGVYTTERVRDAILALREGNYAS